jgi:predicted Zn-dependent peptidase
MEAERMLHPVINQMGLTPKTKLLKKKKRLRFDNSPYGQIIPEVKDIHKHPYRWTTVGSMDHLDAATLTEFQDFNKKFYIQQRRSCSGGL